MSAGRRSRERAGDPGDAPHLLCGPRAVGEALRAGRAVHRLRVSTRARGLAELVGAAEDAGVPVARVEPAALDEASGGVAHQGVIADADPPRRHDLAEVSAAQVLVVCDGITDPQNLGAIARTAEQAGAGGLVLPRKRSAPISAAVERAAAGALSWLPLVEVPGVPAALATLAEDGRWTVGLDGDAHETIYATPVLAERHALVVGAEGRGLARLARERCDVLAAIPTAGRLASLNVSAATAVALFEGRRRRLGW